MAESDRERRADLEALQARTRELKAEAALEESPELPQRRAALKTALSQVQAAAPLVEDETTLLERELGEVRATTAALEEGHRRNEHSSLTVLAVPAALGVPLLALWAFERFGVPVEAAVAAAGFTLPALWLEPLLKWRPPKPEARAIATGLLAWACAASAGWLLPMSGYWSSEFLSALGSAALALGCVGLVTWERARKPVAPRGLMTYARMVALIVLGVVTLPLARHKYGASLALAASPVLLGITLSFFEGRWRTWLMARARARLAAAQAAEGPEEPLRRNAEKSAESPR